jgi:hypothetical protein
MAGRPADKEREKEREKERKQTCVGCKKKFTKSDYCVNCGMCNYWYHKTCAGMSDDIYKCVEAYYKEHSQTFWNCMPCTTYAKGITARMRELEGRIEGVEKHQDKQDQEMEALTKKVADTSTDVKKLEKKLEDGEAGAGVLQELRDRKARKLNVIFYGIGEADSTDPEERKTWDRLSCQNVFDAMKVRLKSNSLKFLRRIGEKGARPRPLLVGMSTLADKELLLENSRKLKDSHLKEVGISSDLTPGELKEERELVAEAERRNKNLSQEDKAKNLKWLVVGQKGEKRMYKGVERAPPPGHPAGQHSQRPQACLPKPVGQRPRINSKRGRRSNSSNESEEEAAGRTNMTKKKQQRTQPESEESESDMEEETNPASQGRTGEASEAPEASQA